MLLCHSLVPMLVMTNPMVLVLGQMALWYQAKPLQVGEETVVTVVLNPSAKEQALADIQLSSSESIEVVTGPVRVPTKHMVCWESVAANKRLAQVEVRVRW